MKNSFLVTMRDFIVFLSVSLLVIPSGFVYWFFNDQGLMETIKGFYKVLLSDSDEVLV